jgi:hypothetical protein
VSYSFPSSFTTFDPSKAFSGGYGNFSSPSALKSGSGGGMDPLSLGLGLGGSLIGGLFGMGQAQTSASIAQAQLAAQNQAILEGREQTKAALGSSMWGPLFAAGTGGDIAFGREQEAKKWMQGPFAERQLGLGSEASKRERLARISPESKEYDRFQEAFGFYPNVVACCFDMNPYNCTANACGVPEIDWEFNQVRLLPAYNPRFPPCPDPY